MLLAIAWTPSLVASPHQLSRASLLRTAASAALTLPLGAKAVAAPPPFELGTRDAFAAFAAGDYTRAGEDGGGNDGGGGDGGGGDGRG